MPTYWYRDQIRRFPNVTNVVAQNLTDMTFEYQPIGGSIQQCRLYNPPREDYIVGQEVIEFAASRGANIVVVDSWGEYTNAAEAYGNRVGIRVYKAGVFLGKIQKGERL